MKRLLLLAAFVAAAAPSSAQSLTGLWDATVTVNKLEIPFRFEIAGSGSSIRGSFFNGDDKVTSTSGSLDGNALRLNFDEYGAAVIVTVKDGALEGEWNRGTRGNPYPLKATRFAPPPAGGGTVPSIAGLWSVQVPAKSSKGEEAWQLIVRQSGPEASAAILRIDGDTGALTGRFRDGTFVLSHFAGARPALLELTPNADGTLTVLQNKANPLTAVRAEVAKAKGLPEPSDPSKFTSVKDPTEAFRFSFPDLGGKLVSNTDPKFAGKVVIVSISGSWCPNCHDEAPFLSELYKKYRAKGLEIVSLSFEEEAQLKNPVRLRAFIKRYGIDYTVLVPGEPRELNDKLPQGVNLNSFPTSFFLGRDGRVRSVHAGFPSKASGKFYDEARTDVTALVERLLAERTQTSSR